MYLFISSPRMFLARFRFAFVLIALSFALPLLADVQSDQEEIYLVVDDMPLYKGKEVEAFAKYIMLHAKLPENLIADETQGTVIVRFMVDRTGVIQSPQIIKGLDPQIDDIIIGIIQDSSGDWTPGRLRNKEVNVQYTLPITIAY